MKVQCANPDPRRNTFIHESVLFTLRASPSPGAGAAAARQGASVVPGARS